MNESPFSALPAALQAEEGSSGQHMRAAGGPTGEVRRKALIDSANSGI